MLGLLAIAMALVGYVALVLLAMSSPVALVATIAVLVAAWWLARYRRLSRQSASR